MFKLLNRETGSVSCPLTKPTNTWVEGDGNWSQLNENEP